VDRDQFERLLKRRTNRRLAIGGSTATLVRVSLAGSPTRSYARQSSADGTPVPSPVADVPLQSRASTQFGVYPFQLGIASGEPLPNGVVLWTRLAPTPLYGGGMDPIPYEVRWEVANDEAFGDVIQSGVAIGDPNLSHSVHVDVTGLEPAREYFYRFMAGSEVTPVGRTKTAPAVGQAIDSLRFAFVSCSNYEHGYFIAYRDIATKAFDFVVHLGDYIYEYGPNEYNVREPENFRLVTGDEIVTLQNYCNRYAIYHTDLDLQAVRASAPFVVTWDDHEVENNYADAISENDDPVTDFLRRRADAYQAYYEHMPLRPWSVPMGPDMGLYRHLNFGDLLNVTVLDTRQYRSDQPAGDGLNPNSPASLDPNTSLTGLEQEWWLLQQMSASTSTWNVIAQQIMMAEIGVTVAEGGVQSEFTDMWSGYPEARKRILSYIADNQIANPVVLTGDIHTAWANDLRVDWEDTSAATVATEYVCTSVTAGGAHPDDFFTQTSAAFPHFKFFDPRHGGYSAATLTRDTWTTDFMVVDNLEDAASGVTQIASYVTQAGTPGAESA
jgi:alkaline phosphatase D